MQNFLTLKQVVYLWEADLLYPWTQGNILFFVCTVANIVLLLQPLICKWLEWALDSYLILHVGFIWCQCACEIYYVEWRVLVWCTLAMYVSWKISHQQFCKIYPAASTMPCERTIYRLVEKLWTSGSMLDRKKMQKLLFCCNFTLSSYYKHIWGEVRK
jgi:hypothetical protein